MCRSIPARGTPLGTVFGRAGRPTHSSRITNEPIGAQVEQPAAGSHNGLGRRAQGLPAQLRTRYFRLFKVHTSQEMRIGSRAALQATLALALLWTGLAEAQVGVLRPGSWYRSSEPDGRPAIIAPRAAVLAGRPASGRPALRPSAEACSQDCRTTDGCRWFEYCAEQVGGRKSADALCRALQTGS